MSFVLRLNSSFAAFLNIRFLSMAGIDFFCNLTVFTHALNSGVMSILAVTARNHPKKEFRVDLLLMTKELIANSSKFKILCRLNVFYVGEANL